MRSVLTDAQIAAAQARAAGLGAVPEPIAGPIRDRYHNTIDTAFTLMPPGPPPPKKHRGTWSQRERDAWNLATRFRNEAGQILLLLDNTAVPATNNHAEVRHEVAHCEWTRRKEDRLMMSAV
jgi:hypothetical protein